MLILVLAPDLLQMNLLQIPIIDDNWQDVHGAASRSLEFGARALSLLGVARSVQLIDPFSFSYKQRHAFQEMTGLGEVVLGVVRFLAKI